MEAIEKFFQLKKFKTNVRTEVIAGLTTFFTMAYIIFVNPNILSLNDGMTWAGVFVATILASVIGTLVMGLFANVPYAQAPGMGLNAFFTFTVCKSLDFQWQEALFLVFLCGVLNIVITVTSLRKSIIASLPESIQHAIGGSIGLFIAYIGIKNAGFLEFVSDPDKYDKLVDGTIIADSSIVPELVKFNSAGVILALIGLVIIIVLLLLKVKGSIFIGIIATTIIGFFMGVVSFEGVKWFDLSAASHVKDVAFSFFGEVGIRSMFSTPERVLTVLTTIFAFSLSDTFDTIGTFIGTGRASGIFSGEDEKMFKESKGFKSRLDRALFADSVATSIGALLGTSNVTTYVESTAGIAEGGRTGLTSTVVGIMFLLCLPFAGLFGIVPAQATAPALIVVGIMMAAPFAEIKWSNFEEAVPAFMIAVFMAFGYSISYGIAAGLIFHCIVKICTGEAKKLHPILIGASVLFLINFVIIAVRG